MSDPLESNTGEGNSSKRIMMPGRSHPFLLMFFQAIISFKRKARMLKEAMARRQLKKEKTEQNSMKKMLEKSNSAVKLAMNGATVITLNHQEVSNHRRLLQKQMEEELLELQRQKEADARAAASSPKQKRHFGNVADKLRRCLKPSDLSANVEQSAAHGTDELGGIITRNATTAQTESKQVRDYMAGTAIYYGATIALQARHGGFLSYHDSHNIRASAHKILHHSKYMLAKAADVTFGGAVRYGDAILMQAGQFELFGAQYCGEIKNGEETRQIRPALISFRKENAYKAQQVLC